MKVTVSTEAQDCFLLDVSEDLELENFKAFCEVQSGYSADKISIVFQGTTLKDNKKTLKDYGIHDGDLVLLNHAGGSQNTNNTSLLPNFDFSGISIPQAGTSSGGVTSFGGNGAASNSNGKEDPAYVRQLLLANPDQVAILKHNNPPLAEALLSGSAEDFARVLNQQFEERRKREQLKQRMLSADPFDTEAQKLIAEEIKRNNINANMEAAMEYNPETFGTVVMLYINCRVNGHPVKAFIDSGAQTTIMSSKCAERVNIQRLIDTRWAGIAKGVGVQKITGRIHMVQLEIENIFLTTSFSVLEEQRMDVLVGLDMLRRHQCVIDLRRNVLVIGTTQTETKFLSEGDLPETARLTYNDDEDMVEKAVKDSLNDFSNGAGTSSTSANSGGGSSSTPTSNNRTFPEDIISEITKCGFSREQAITELTRFDGDKKQALAALLAKSLSF